KSAVLTLGLKVPVAGLDRRSAREPLASRFYDERIAVPRDQHAVERVRQLFAQALGYRLPARVGDYGLDRAWIAGEKSGADYLVFLHGTTWVTKHWPELYWRQLAELASARGFQVKLPWGNDAEKARAERTAPGFGAGRVPPKLRSGDYGLDRAWIAGEKSGADYLVFLHGATWVTKDWPELYWRQLAELASARGFQVKLPWGNDAEKARAERIAQGLEGVQVLPKL